MEVQFFNWHLSLWFVFLLLLFSFFLMIFFVIWLTYFFNDLNKIKNLQQNIYFRYIYKLYITCSQQIN